MLDRRVILTIFVLLAAAGFTFAAQSNGLPEMPTMPAMPTGINSTTNPPAGIMPSIGDLMTIVDKATADQGKAKDWSTPLKLVIIFTGLAILPSLLVMVTSFTRIVIVLSFVRRALTTQTIPPNIAIMGLALFLTLYTMTPTLGQINVNAVQPYIADQINFQAAAQKTGDSIKEFMLRQCRAADLALFVQMAKMERPGNPMDIGLHVVIPAFVISEFRTAFEMGCLLFIPFLLIDMVIASVLLSAGMMMLPPTMISMPLKLILFILVDGWGLLAKSLSLSFR